jgi:hypothetical protein
MLRITGEAQTVRVAVACQVSHERHHAQLAEEGITGSPDKLHAVADTLQSWILHHVSLLSHLVSKKLGPRMMRTNEI